MNLFKQYLILLVSILLSVSSIMAYETTVFSDDFETDKGWLVNPNSDDNATTGIWEWADPDQTMYYNYVMQPHYTADGIRSLSTGPLAGSNVGSYDIDGGKTSIESPAIPLPFNGNITLSFSYLFAYYDNATTDDYLRVSVVGTETQKVFEVLASANIVQGAWNTFSISLNDFAGETVTLLVEAADNGDGSLVEAGIDGVDIIVDRSGFYWSGEWQASALYLENDIVEYGGSSYIAIASSNAQIPSTGSEWNLLALKGEQGDQGIQGVPGTDGIDGIQGETGTAGSNFLSDLDAPLDSEGNDGDTYLNMSKTAYYKKIAGTWELQIYDESKAFKDSRDGNIYSYVTLGSQVWMAENLNYDAGSDSYCYNDIEDSCHKYGQLYTWDVLMDGADASSSNPSGVQGICPSGWHLPSLLEWQELEAYVDANNGSEGNGESLKSKKLWLSNNNGTDLFKMNILPAGRKNEDGSYSSFSLNGFYRNTDNNTRWITFSWYNNDVNYINYPDNVAFSVRCLKD